MSAINTNIGAIRAHAHATKASRLMEKHMDRLSSGVRINNPSDDAAGVAIASKMYAQIRGINMSIQNSSNGIGLIQTAESGTNEVMNMLFRLKELSVQMHNGVYSAEDRANADIEKEQLLLGINNITQNTKFNSVNLLDGSYTSQIQVGNSTSEIMTLAIPDIGLANLATGLDTISLTTASGAASAATIIETAIDTLAEEQSMLGAKQDRLQHNINYQANTVTQTEQARGRIIDTDYALETSELAKQQILSQAATSMLAHANQSSDYLLNLIAS